MDDQNIITPPSRQQIDSWLEATTAKVLQQLKEDVELHERSIARGKLVLESDTKRYELLRRNLEKDRVPRSIDGKLRPTNLERIIRGYLVEFIRQSEEGAPSHNAHMDKEPTASYWASRSRQEFLSARLLCNMHTAAAHHHIKKEEHPTKSVSVSFDALGEIILTSIAIFTEELHTLYPGLAPSASVVRPSEEIISARALLQNLSNSMKSR